MVLVVQTRPQTVQDAVPALILALVILGIMSSAVVKHVHAHPIIFLYNVRPANILPRAKPHATHNVLRTVGAPVVLSQFHILVQRQILVYLGLAPTKRHHQQAAILTKIVQNHARSLVLAMIPPVALQMQTVHTIQPKNILVHNTVQMHHAVI